MKLLLCAFLVLLLMPMGVFACAQNEIDVNGDGALCETAKFEITTTNLSVGDEFKFNMSASGTFYVDCGNGGTLSSDNNDVSEKTISRENTDEILYTCTYTSGGLKTIKFSGKPTRYYANNDRGTIDFYKNATPQKIASLDGSLSALFPQLEWSGAGTPSFKDTFRTASNLTSIPDGLFANFKIRKNSTFEATFKGCSSLTRIPDNLFVNVTDNYAPRGYASMFSGCSSLTYIPNGLFENRNVGLLAFYQTFGDCPSLTTIPKDLFANIKIGGYGVFQMTFWRDTSLNAIPDGLFDSITTSYPDLFKSTFGGCSSLSYIPANLFANITTPAERMFEDTFFRCLGLRGYIPPSLFAGLNNSGKYSTDMMTGLFAGTNLDTSCPAGMVQFITGYEDYWNGHVSCVDENFVCAAGEYLPAHGYECAECPENNYCTGGTYTYSENTAYGATQCPNSWYAPRGMSSADQCGRILHIGDNVVYLRNVKKTSPSLNVRVDGYTFYGNMTTADVPMNANTTAHMKVQFNNETYSIYDDTVTP